MEREPDEGGRKAFGSALVDAIRSAGLTVPKLAELVGVSDDAVRKWTYGNPPTDPQRVFTIERHVEVSPGELSRHLGYLPVDAGVSVLAAIDADPRLPEVAKRLLAGSYKQALRD